MELDDFKPAWQDFARQLERHERITRRTYRLEQARRFSSRTRIHRLGQWLQLALGLAMAWWGVNFWTTHRHPWQAMACGIAMQAFGTLAIIFTARVMVLSRGIDYAEPVVEIQRKIAQLRHWRVKVEAPVFSALGSVIWIPALLMLLQYAMDTVGANPWDGNTGLGSWLAISTVVSPAAVAVFYGVVRWLGYRRWLQDAVAGSTVTMAERMLEEIEQFEKE